MEKLKVPVLFLIFKRESEAVESFRSIREYKPMKLYIAADGPRDDKGDENILCERTRKSILEMIDWECEINLLFREKNLGCANAVNDAITWFFKKEEFGIIIEDDCNIHPDFYTFCEELMPLYQDKSQVMQINAHNPAGGGVVSNKYVFGRTAFIWGWATWKRAWEKMDMNMQRWPEYSTWSLIKDYGIFQGLFRKYYWQKHYNMLASSQSWATRWNFSVYANQGLCISSKANFSRNSGIVGSGGTHYKNITKDPYAELKFGKIILPLIHPQKAELTKTKQHEDSKEFFRLRIYGLKQMLCRFLRQK